MKEGAARAVLREAWLRGHRCVELQRDGRTTIFVCARCGTRCYSDAALGDHLRGNLHARRTAAVANEKNLASRGVSEERATIVRENEKDDDQHNQADGLVLRRNGVRGGPQIVWAGPAGIVGPSRIPLEWIGSGELFFSFHSANLGPVVDSSWFTWKGKSNQSPESDGQGGQGGGIIYAVVMFPYSDMIGRGGDWESPSWSESKQATSFSIEGEDRVSLTLPLTNSSRASVAAGAPGHVSLIAPQGNSLPTVVDKSASQLGLEQHRHIVNRDSSRGLRPSCKRKKAKIIERLCFICHQRMNSGRDVAALLNLHTKQMVCGSRNKRGVFHVYHSSCLIDWISICEVKAFTGQLDHRIDRTRKLTRSRRAVVEQPHNHGSLGEGGSFTNEGAIFCPECQGTGLWLRGAQLERPRYRLAQVFDWILELIQARKAWTEKPRKDITSRSGLLFSDGNEQPVTVQSRGLLHYYSGSADLLTGSSIEK